MSACPCGGDSGTTFAVRTLDVISSAGYRIGRFDVESCLLEHDSVAESAVVGKPDAQRGEIVAAYVVLHERYNGGESLIAELTQHVCDRLGKHAFPRDMRFVQPGPFSEAATGTGESSRSPGP